ncbi:MAG: type II and III secretion system protein, partial [Gemmataceae bacterium]|nr:type II and III secretion system protein [Gemmataceae bacterium]
EVLKVTTEEFSRGKQRTVTYQVADLVVNLDPAAQTPLQGLGGNQQGSSGNGGFNYAAPTPVAGPMSLGTGTPVGSPTGGIVPPAPTRADGQVHKRSAPTMEADLIRLITNSVAPQSWSEMGGQGTIEFHPLTLAMVVNQTPDIQEQILDLLTALRRLQDQTVSVEVRMITVTEDFFERIGVNFAMNILTDKATRRFEPLLLNGTFVSDPLRFINNVPNLTGLVSGVTPAGSLTPSLDIPITQSSFYQTFPQFGGYTGGGLNVGLAFLSDIQVFLFMEALQGDTRANVMQAPKITCANGQSALVQVGEGQSFLTSVQVTGLPGGQFAFVPQFNQVQNQVTLNVTPLITDDRRFVRMSLAPQLQSILPGPVPVIPVTVPIFTNLTSDLTVSQPVVFTQYVQTPRQAFVSVQTEVRIPDGGTVVMGGLKRLAEARSEFGPPVLSKIPYINRLFKNVGYGRETESLLIMVTARIIVLSEEEVRSTGFDSFGTAFSTDR